MITQGGDIIHGSSQKIGQEGDPSSPFWLVGEAWGAVEERTGLPFQGPAGQLLDRIIRDAGGIREELFISNVFEERPPANDIYYFFEDKNEMYPSHPTVKGRAYIDALRDRILKYRPNLIVAAGRVPLWALTGENHITKWRGSLMPCIFDREIKVYPMYHPSFVMRKMQEKGEDDSGHTNLYPTSVKDFMRARSQTNSREWPDLTRKYILPTTVSQCTSYLQHLHSFSHVACDIETIVLEDKPPLITRIGFAPSLREGMSIPIIKRGALAWTLLELATILREISELFLSTKVKKVFQGGLFDLTILGHIFGLRCATGTVEDTMVQQHCAYPHLPKGLAYQTSVYTWWPYYKEERKQLKTGSVSDEALSIYNINDCCQTVGIQPITEHDIRSMDMVEGWQRTMSAYPVLLYKMLKGVKIDLARNTELGADFEAKRQKQLELIQAHAGVKLNPGSVVQLRDALFFQMGFPIKRLTKKGKAATDKNTLISLKRQTGHEIFKAIETYRKYNTLITRYTNSIFAENGRDYTHYDPTGTVTWRLSSYGSPLGVGKNRQNIPKRDEEGKQIREIYIADPGKVLIAADLEQAEDRHVTWKAGDLEGIARYEQGLDPHWEKAKEIARFQGLELPEVFDPSSDLCQKWRNKLAKHVKHANNYGVGPIKFHQLLAQNDFHEYSVSDCKEILAAGKMATPMVEQWKAWTREKIGTDRTLITVLNRKRIFYGRIDDDLYRKAYAFDPQSTIGELLLIIERDLHNELFHLGLEVLMNVHDEVVVQVPEDKVDYFIPLMRAIMEKTLMVEDIYGNVREMVIPVDFKYGKSWGRMTKWKEAA